MTRSFRLASTLALLLAAGCDGGGLVAQPLEIVIPAHVQSIPSGTLHAHVWAYDPYLMDTPARNAGHWEIEFSHEQGKMTRRSVFLSASYGEGERVYFSVEGCGNTIEGPQHMLWDGITETGTPHRVVMQWLTNQSPCQF